MPFTTLPNGLRVFQFAQLGRLPALVHAVSTRQGGLSRPPYAALNLALHVGDDPATVRQNRRRLAAGLALAPDDLAVGVQVHGCGIARIQPAPARARAAAAPRHALPEADALMTDVPGIGLLVLVADCVPILLFDARRRVVATAHAGWKGTAAGIAARVVAALADAYDTRPADLWVGIGPSIGPGDYEVGPEVRAAFERAQPDRAASVAAWFRTGRRDRSYLDLWTAIRDQLIAAGVPPAQIEVAGISSAAATQDFYSHRCEGGLTGRFGGIIALR